MLFIFNVISGTFTEEYYPIDKIFEMKTLFSLLYLGIVASSLSFMMWNKSIKLI